jgi:hypothetical protein
MMMASCTYDSEELFFGTPGDCDTTAVSYSEHISPVMAVSCNACHNSSSPSGGVITSGYVGLSAAASSGRLVGAVWHFSGYSPMPLAQPQLDSCSMKRIMAWVNQGHPDN